jgi:hypothetical protein|tara:strand:- start:800 stop:1564 length:765 start_codon:yes stop_codon:yes gene_type:complete
MAETPEPIDPILAGQTAEELLSDPLVRALYFGTEDQPGFFNQLLTAGQEAREGITGGLGMYLPYLQRSEELGEQAYTPITQSDIDEFMNPYEDAVVQKSIDDALRGFDQSEIMKKAQNIASGGESAYGSRAGLFAGERARQFGEGLGSMISGLRSSGFRQALDNAYRSKDLLGRGAQFQQGLASLYPQYYYQDVMRPLGLMQAIGGLLPGYDQGKTVIKSQYGIPQDPAAGGLGAALSLYSGFNNPYNRGSGDQ